MNTIHRPDPEFVGNLERELRLTVRRQGRFANGLSAPVMVMRKLRWTTGLVALAAMCIGSAATFAVTHRLRAQTADLIIARAEAHLEFASARLELFGEELQETESRAAAGLIEPEHLDQMQLELAHVEAEAAARALDVQEARISAPTWRGRDFVSVRLELQRALLVARAAILDKRASKYASDSHQSSTIAREQEATRAALASMDGRLVLRQDYLSGARTARQVELAQMRWSIEPQREMSTRRVNELQQQLDRMRALVEAGLASRAEARAVEMAFRAAVLQLDLAELEMQILERKLTDPSDQ